MSNTSYNSNDNNNSTWISIVVIGILLCISACVIYLVMISRDDEDDPIPKAHHVKTEQNLMRNMPYLIYETNFPLRAEKCLANKSYGVDENGDFYVKDGCSGIFLYRDNNNRDFMGVCTTSETKDEPQTCPIGRMVPSKSPINRRQIEDPVNPMYTFRSDDHNTNLNGLIQKDDRNIKIMRQNGLCTPDNYGFYGNNMIYTNNGCEGIFRIGPLIGQCGSTSSDPSNPPQMTKCPIGYKEKIDGRNMGLVLTDLKSLDTSERCMSTDNSYGYRDSDTGFRDLNYCRNNLIFSTDDPDHALYAKYEVNCKPDTSECSLNSVKQ